MGTDENQKNVFTFLQKHFETKEPFTKADLEGVTDWKGQTPSTYWSKHLRPFVIYLEDGTLRVSEGFRRCATWEKFHAHVTQMRDASVDYQELKFEVVRIYEFFMPLTNEAFLRSALDGLFYRDTIEARLRTINSANLNAAFPRKSNEEDSGYLDRLCSWISDHFGGYSIYHVNGRFRALPLAARAESGQGSSRYLVDETTAVTRFIFPCASVEESEQVAFFFTELFVGVITEVVNGEDEIWMVETGLKNQLHIWRVVK